MPAYAAAPSAAVIPGTTSKGMPLADSESISSPPRPKTNGSPPLRRSTRLPACASSTNSALIASCRIVCRARCFAHVDLLRARRQQREDLGRDQVVVERHVGALDELHRADGEEVRFARSGADEIDLAAASAPFRGQCPCTRGRRAGGRGARHRDYAVAFGSPDAGPPCALSRSFGLMKMNRKSPGSSST